MANKFERVTELYEQTAKTVSSSPEDWQAFLRSACKNFKLRFDEQLLIYAQRPAATAVLEIGRWNTLFGRWVNRETKGIAVFEDAERKTHRLVHYFDIADTHETRYSRPVPIWEMKPEYTEEVVAALEGTFGELRYKNTLDDAIFWASRNAVEDNVPDYLSDLLQCTEGSLLEGLDEVNISVIYRHLVMSSVAYMLTSRLGGDTEACFHTSDFQNVTLFTTAAVLNQLGKATSDIAEMGLTEISHTISALERKNLALAKENSLAHNKTISEGRSNENVNNGRNQEQNHISAGGRLLDSRSGDAAAEGIRAGALRAGTEEVSEGASPRPLHESADGMQAERAPLRDGAESARHGGSADGADERERGNHGAAQGQRHDGVGTRDEFDHKQSSGNRDGGSNLRLDSSDTIKPLPSQDGQYQLIFGKAEDESPAFLFSQEQIDDVLASGSGFERGKMRIYEQFGKGLSAKENVDFLKKEYGDGRKYPALIGTDIYESHDAKGIYLSRGIGNDKPHIVLKWTQVEKRIGELIRLDRYLNPKEREQYPVWLEKEEAKRAGLAEKEAIREIPFSQPDVPDQNREPAAPEDAAPGKKYEYHLGDVVYLGANEYEILSFDENRVMLYDPELPLFHKEYARGDFDRMVAENPLNDHLIVQAKAAPEAEPDAEPAPFDINEYDDPDYYEQQKLAEQEALQSEKEKEAVPSGTEPVHFYQMGDFYEAYGEDAVYVSNNFNLHIASRMINGKRVSVCGFPAKQIEEYVSALEERGIYSIVSTEKPIEELHFDALEFEKHIPHEMRFKEADVVNGNEVYWVTQEAFTVKDLEQFQQAVREHGEEIQKFYVTVRDLSGYNFEEDVAHKVLATVTPDTLFAEDYLAAIKEAGMEEWLLEEDDFSDIDAEAVRKNLAEHGIENGMVVDAEKLDNSPFIKEVNAALEEISDAEPEEEPDTEPEAKQTTELDAEPAARPIVPQWEQKKKASARSFDLHPEIPMSERQMFDLKAHPVETVGKKERFRRNLMAIQLLKKCQEENRFATSEEQEILSKYVGWGGIPEAFDENNPSWETEFLELSVVLTPEEYARARESTLTAFFTPPAVIEAIYQAMEQMGFREGNLLEPSCGIGNFIGLLPDSMQSSKVYGVELDPVSAGIAQQLYQKSSIAAKGFEEVNLPDSFFDAVVGNVPFGDIRVLDKRYDKYHFLIHDYFFAKSLDKLRPGGILALVTSKGTMDKENSSVRKYLAQRADLLGAIRLPNNAFSGNAGTEVVSDILFLQKRDGMTDVEPDWVFLDTDANGIRMNSYFVSHPEMILGEMKMVSGRFGMEATCVADSDVSLSEQLREAIANIHGELSVAEAANELEEKDDSLPADPDVRNFSYTVIDDRLYFRENSRMLPTDVPATAENRIKGMIRIRDCVRNLITLQTEDGSDAQIREAQKKLEEEYDTFTQKYGLLNGRANKSAFESDSSYPLLTALEVIDENGELESKADMFTKRTIRPHKVITRVDTASEALAVSIGEKARVDMAYMRSLTGKTEEQLYDDLKGVIFLNPMYGHDNSTAAKYLMADEYLSGNVREKLQWAKKAAEISPEDYNLHVEALKKVQPKDLTASEISVRLGATWLPTGVVEQFIYEFLDTPFLVRRWNLKLRFDEATSEWSIEGKSSDKNNVKATSTYGTSRINAYAIIEDTLNLKDVRIFDYIEDDDGRRRAVLNKKETAIAQGKQEMIKQGFQDWIWKDPNRREILCKLYNEKFNSIRPREYDGSHIAFHGMNPEIDLRDHQKNAVAHILYGGNTLLAHAVGAGKTYEMAAAAMESKRLGLCSKSLFVVPNHLTEQWASEFLRLYPAANVLVATKKDFETKNRKRFCGRIATGDYDAVIIGHSQFEKIPMSLERQRASLERQIDELTDSVADMKYQAGKKFSVKQTEKTRRSIQQKLQKLNDQTRKDDVVTFEELGVDRLFIDESHYYKNLYLYTKMRNVGGIAQTEAQKSSDLFMKCRYLDEITGGRGTVFATGTPISNSMVELYTIQRYLQYHTLKKSGLQSFDAWASTFGETITAVELTPEGTGYRAKTRFAKFYNLPELMAMFREVADIQTADMLNLPVPQVNYHNVAVKPSELQREMVASLAERAERVRNGNVDSSVDNMLKITNDGRKLALDQRMINPLLPDFGDSKGNACVENIFRIWEETSAQRSAQLVFCDLSTPKGEKEFSIYTDIRKKLVEKGIPADEIRFIHEADTEVKKQELFKKVRKGEVRVLLGSTQKMGAGTNVQDRLIALHDLDCPWRPSDLEQRSGRIIRQGNENKEVEIYRYVTEQTFDAYLYQLVEGKQKFVSQIMTSKSPVRSAEDIDETALSYAEIKMLATGNPYIKEKMDLDVQVQRLRLLKANFLSEKYNLEDKILKFYPQSIARSEEQIRNLTADVQTAKEHPKPTDDRFVGIRLQGIDYTEKAEAGKAIIRACKEMTNPEPVELGSYRGFSLELSFDEMKRDYEVKIKGESSRSVYLGDDIYGNLIRIDNAIERLPEVLEGTKSVLNSTKRQLETAKQEVQKPFAKEEELKSKTARLEELNILLNLDHRENEIAGEEAEEAPESVPEEAPEEAAEMSM